MFRCFKHHAEGRVANPEGCPENPLRERQEEEEEEGLFKADAGGEGGRRGGEVLVW